MIRATIYVDGVASTCCAREARAVNPLRGNDLLQRWQERIYEAHNGIFYGHVGASSVWCCVRDLADEVELQAAEIEELREQIEDLRKEATLGEGQ